MYTIIACYFFWKYFKSAAVSLVCLAVKKYFKKHKSESLFVEKQ